MTIEAHFVAVLNEALGVPTYFGVAPQKQDDAPIDLPVVVVNRITSNWFSTLCGTDLDLSDVMLQVDVYDLGAEGARRIADRARAALSQDASVPVLDGELFSFDSGSKAWRVVQTWRAPDYQPALSEAIR